MKRVVFGHSVRGAAHIRSGTECQDSYMQTICDDGTIILSVADGHGSKACPYSRTGAEIAVNVFCSIIKAIFDGYAEHPEQLVTYLNREGEICISQSIDMKWKKCIVETHMKNNREIPALEDGSDDLKSVYNQYGTTLLGLALTKTFVFALQLGDGDICHVNPSGLELVIEPEKVLGVETHSLSSEDAWKKVNTIVHRFDLEADLPVMFTLSSDGFANSYKSESEFHYTVLDYFKMINEYGAKTVEENLPSWLSETSSMGCGDDITLLIAHFSRDEEDRTSERELSEDEKDIVE